MSEGMSEKLKAARELVAQEWEVEADRVAAQGLTVGAGLYRGRANDIRRGQAELEAVRAVVVALTRPAESALSVSREARAKAVLDGWTEGNADWATADETTRMRCYFVLDALDTLTAREGV